MYIMHNYLIFFNINRVNHVCYNFQSFTNRLPIFYGHWLKIIITSQPKNELLLSSPASFWLLGQANNVHHVNPQQRFRLTDLWDNAAKIVGISERNRKCFEWKSEDGMIFKTEGCTGFYNLEWKNTIQVLIKRGNCFLSIKVN